MSEVTSGYVFENCNVERNTEPCSTFQLIKAADKRRNPSPCKVNRMFGHLTFVKLKRKNVFRGDVKWGLRALVALGDWFCTCNNCD